MINGVEGELATGDDIPSSTVDCSGNSNNIYLTYRIFKS